MSLNYLVRREELIPIRFDLEFRLCAIPLERSSALSHCGPGSADAVARTSAPKKDPVPSATTSASSVVLHNPPESRSTRSWHTQETQLANVAPAKRVRIHVDTYRQKFEGLGDSIARAAGSRQALLPPQNATGNFVKVVLRIPVKILVKPSKNPTFVLRAGMKLKRPFSLADWLEVQ